MNFLKKIPAWLIGGFVGLIYFLITYFIDVGACQINQTYCGGMTGLATMILNFPSTLLIYISPLRDLKIPGNLLGIEAAFIPIMILDVIFGSMLGFLIGKLISFMHKRN